MVAPTAPPAASTAPPAGAPTGAPARARAAPGSWLLLGTIVAASASLGWLAGREHGQLAARPAAGAGPGGLVLVEASFDGGKGGEADGGGLRVGPGGTASALVGPVPGPFLGPDPAPGPVPVPGTASGDAPADPGAPAELVGRLKADLLSLRALYRRLADVAELDGGEFDVEFESDRATGDGEPLSALDPADPDALGVLIERIDPMLDRSRAMERLFVERRRDYDARVSGRPLEGGAISSGFGRRQDPLTGRTVSHRGLDFTGAVGQPIHALADGVVTYAGANGGYGRLVELQHADGYRTRYAHNDAVLVELGALVRKGEPIATLGNSGRSTGPHLHLEVRRDGTATDPRFFVR